MRQGNHRALPPDARTPGVLPRMLPAAPHHRRYGLGSHRATPSKRVRHAGPEIPLQPRTYPQSYTHVSLTHFPVGLFTRAMTGAHGSIGSMHPLPLLLTYNSF